MSTAAEKKAAEKKRAAADAAKKAKKGGTVKSKASDSFNYKSIGISDATWNKLSAGGKSSLAIQGSQLIKIMEKNQPLPELLDDKEMNKLWKEAEKDPVIQKYYAEEMNVAKDYLNKNIDLASAEFKSLTEQQQRAYIDAKNQLDEAQASAGTAYSGFRQQANKKMETDQSGIVESSRSALQKQLNQYGQEFESRFGSTALAGTEIANPLTAGTVGNYGNLGYQGASYNPVNYTAIGGIAGTQASDILKDKLQKQQDLAAEQEQANALENIKREKKLKEAYDKLGV